MKESDVALNDPRKNMNTKVLPIKLINGSHAMSRLYQSQVPKVLVRFKKLKTAKWGIRVRSN